MKLGVSLITIRPNQVDRREVFLLEGSSERIGVPSSAPSEIIGHHGCSKQIADIILSGSQFRQSTNRYDWLGNGIYFWEFGYYRAAEWAQELHGANWAVLEATIKLGNCLNLLDVAHYDHMSEAFARYKARAEALGVRLTENKDGAHNLDRAVIEFYCQDHEASGGKPFQTVRGCFPEGGSMFEGSKILRESHIQIAVRDVACISLVKQVKI